MAPPEDITFSTSVAIIEPSGCITASTVTIWLFDIIPIPLIPANCVFELVSIVMGDELSIIPKLNELPEELPTLPITC